jgi:hypothetical protein
MLVRSTNFEKFRKSSFRKIPEFRKIRNFENVGEFPGFRKTFSGISEILKRRELFGKFILFYKTALRSSVHIIKISVKLVEFVFSEKIPENVSGRLRKSEIPEKSAVFRFSDDAKIQPISGKSAGKNFRENRTFFGGKFPKKIRKIRKFGKFRKKKCKNVDFGKFNPRLQSAFKTHILRS